MHYLFIFMHNYSCPIKGLLRIGNACVAIKQHLNYFYVLKMVHVPFMVRRVRLLHSWAAPPARRVILQACNFRLKNGGFVNLHKGNFCTH